MGIKKEVIMPGLNQSGPRGEGPRTGRGLGKCNSKNPLRSSEETTDDSLAGLGRGRRRGCNRGGGRGLGRGNRN